MEATASRPGRRLLQGTVSVFLAEALMVPTGLLTVAYLSRRLGPAGYGRYALAATLVVWVEWVVATAFARATIKFVGEAEDWRPVGATVVRLHLAASLPAVLLLWLLAGPIANLLNERVLAGYLLLFALEIPIFSLAHAHRNILIGVGSFSQRALASAGRWVSRLILIVLLVEMGLSVPGAILGSIGASLVELGIGRFFVRPSLLHPAAVGTRRLWSYAIPLLPFSLTLQLYDKMDLVLLKALGGTAEQAGIYAVAQNMALPVSILALAFSPLLLSTLSHSLRRGERGLARKMVRDAMRIVLVILPFAAMTAGASSEIINLIFGAVFVPAAPLLAVLIFGGVSLVMISVAAAVLTAADKPGWTVALGMPLVVSALSGHLLLIPRFGAIGAAVVTASMASLGALLAMLFVYRVWRVLPPAGTVLRSALVSVLAYVLAAVWSTPNLWLLLKITVIATIIPTTFFVLGELSDDEVAMARRLLPG